MKKILSVFIPLYLITYSSFGQQPWAPDGAKWYYTHTNNWTFYGYRKYEKTGDTLINGINCDNLLMTIYGYDYVQSNFTNETTHQYSYENGGVVYRFYNNQFIKMYDFNAMSGDTLTVPDDGSCPGYFLVDSISPVDINNDLLNSIYLSASWGQSFKITITEKIGCGFDLFPFASCVLDQPGGDFRCYSDNSGWTYSSSIATSCDFTTNLSSLEPDNLIFLLSPNPANNQLTIHISRPTEHSGGRASLYGKEVTVSTMNVLGQETSPPAPLHLERGEALIDVSKLNAGIYFVKVVGEKERWVGKFVKSTNTN